MIAVKIILGLIGLGVVIFIHELGHFIAARLSGIDVDAFSIGWGKPILKKKIGSVEYRLGLFPLGGYCKMKGDNDYQEVWENKNNGIEMPKGSFFFSHPSKRIFTAFAGPLFNFLFAVIVLAFIWGKGIEIETLDNRIVLLADIDGQSYPSDKGGLLTGDKIVEINGKEINNYRDIQENIALNPDKALSITVNRGGEQVKLAIHTNLDKSGAGKIGVYPWTSPVITAIRPGSPAEAAGLKPGDRILSVNGEELPYTVAFVKIFNDDKPANFSLGFERNGKQETAEIRDAVFISEIPDLGIEYPSINFTTPVLSPFAALATGGKEAVKTFAISVKSLRLLFKKGIDLTQAVSGPVRISYMMGEITSGGFKEGIAAGFNSALSFLSLISIALCLMNLLPLPILDGGMIVLYTIEMIKRRPIHPRVISAFQTAGMVIIFCLMIFAAFNDILFFTKR